MDREVGSITRHEEHLFEKVFHWKTLDSYDLFDWTSTVSFYVKYSLALHPESTQFLIGLKSVSYLAIAAAQGSPGTAPCTRVLLVTNLRTGDNTSWVSRWPRSIRLDHRPPISM